VIYRSPRGLYPFQVEGIRQWVNQGGMLCTWGTGCGKSHLSLAGGSLLFEEGLIRLLLIVCEQNKVPEWVPDFEEFTTLRVKRYAGTPAQREKIRASLLEDDAPQVLVATYETSRNDLGGFVSVPGKKGRSRKEFRTGPLTDTLVQIATDGGLAISYDESTKLGNRYEAGHRHMGRWISTRGSVTYKAHEAMLKAVRAARGRLWVAGMSAIPIETSPDNAFNQLRLFAPHVVGSIKHYEDNYVLYRDPFGKATYKNLTANDPNHRDPWVTPFDELIAPVINHKSKTDPDVREAFPEATEEPMYVTLHKDHLALYHAVQELGNDEELFPEGMSKEEEDVMFGLLRQVAAHPASLIHSPAALREGTLANMVVTRVGERVLSEIPCAKEDALVTKLGVLVDDLHSQVVVFSFFGNSVIPLLRDRLEREGFRVTTYTGSMSSAAKQASITAFQQGQFDVILCSDAAARGINLPQAQYVMNYEMCLTHAKTTQRINRLSRIGSGHASITAFSMVALETVEEPILELNMKRQGWHEAVLPDDHHHEDLGESIVAMDADARRAMFARVRSRVS
jgi:hypothetical protein